MPKIKYRTDAGQAGQSADRPNSMPGVNIAASRARSGSQSMLYAVLAFFLLQSMGALNIVDRIFYGDWLGKGSDKLTLMLNLLAILASLFLFWSGAQKSRIAWFNRLLPIGAASILLTSVLWSVDPRVTLTQGAAYFFVVVGAIGIAQAFDSDELIDSVTWISGLCAVASIAQLYILPEPGDFRGIFAQKNPLGEAMAVGVLSALHMIRISRGGRRFRSVCIAALCTCVAVMSNSTTSILVIASFVWLDILGRFYLKGGSIRTTSIYLGLASISVVVLLEANPDVIYDLFGKDSTLSGRTLIWPYVIDQISEKPFLGWGFCAFWSSANPLSFQISKAIANGNWWIFVVPNAHNGLLEMLLQIGFLGTAFFMFLFGRNFVTAIKCLNGPAAQLGLSSVLLLMGILVTGVSEDVLLAAQQPWTNLFFLVGFLCEKKVWLARAVQTQGMITPARQRASAHLAFPRRGQFGPEPSRKPLRHFRDWPAPTSLGS